MEDPTGMLVLEDRRIAHSREMMGTTAGAARRRSLHGN
jgi:hypothetical protein